MSSLPSAPASVSLIRSSLSSSWRRWAAGWISALYSGPDCVPLGSFGKDFQLQKGVDRELCAQALCLPSATFLWDRGVTLWSGVWSTRKKGRIFLLCPQCFVSSYRRPCSHHSSSARASLVFAQLPHIFSSCVSCNEAVGVLFRSFDVIYPSLQTPAESTSFLAVCFIIRWPCSILQSRRKEPEVSIAETWVSNSY